MSTLVGMPGASVAAFVRFSWQPPQKRCSPARPLIQIDSLAMLMAYLSMSCWGKGTFPGTRAANELSGWMGTSAYSDCPSNSVVLNMRGPSSPEKPSMSRTLPTDPAGMVSTDES